MNKWVPVAVAAAQIVALGFMAGEREWVARTGTEILLRTAPLDPRDPMRGDYVRLDFEVAYLPRRLCSEEIATWFDQANNHRWGYRDCRIYTKLHRGTESIADVISISDQKPQIGLFLRGRVAAITRNRVQVRYGVEAYFMEQGKAREFENEMRTEKVGVPVNATVAVGGNGLGVLTGYRWEPLGITLAFDWTERAADSTNPRPRRRMTGITVQLKNHSTDPVAIVSREGARSFRLIQNERWNPNKYKWVGEDTIPPVSLSDEVMVLGAGEKHATFLDLSKTMWFLTKIEGDGSDEPLAMEALEERPGVNRSGSSTCHRRSRSVAGCHMKA